MFYDRTKHYGCHKDPATRFNTIITTELETMPSAYVSVVQNVRLVYVMYHRCSQPQPVHSTTNTIIVRHAFHRT